MTSVLFWHWGRRGAGPRITLELARAMEASGADVLVSYSRQAEVAAALGRVAANSLPVNTYRSRREAVLGARQALLASLQMRRFLKRHRVDALVATMEHAWHPLARLLAQCTEARYVVCIHDPQRHMGEESVLFDLVRAVDIALSDGIITFSESARQDFLEAWPRYPAERVFATVHPAFEWKARFEPRSHSPDSKPLRLLFFGRIQPYKGLDMLLEAMPIIREECPDAQLTVAGSGTVVGRPSVGINWVTGWIREEDVEDLFAEADIVVLPYREATQSGVAALALGLGVPLVVTPVGALPEQIESTGAGIVADEVSAEALSRAVCALWGDAARYEGCSSAAIEAAHGSHSWSRAAADIMSAVLELASFRKPSWIERLRQSAP